MWCRSWYGCDGCDVVDVRVQESSMNLLRGVGRFVVGFLLYFVGR